MNGSVLVIGGGIVGSAIAFELQDRGVETTLIDRDLEPQGVSAFSFASLSAIDAPARELYLLKSLGLLGWHRWAKRFDDLGLTWDGEIRWAESPEGAAHLRTLFKRASDRGYPIRTMYGADVLKHLPRSSPGDVLAAFSAPEDGQADPVRAIKTLRRAFVEGGGTVEFGRAGLMFDDDAVRVRLGERTMDADKIVVATGAETANVLARFGWDIPMDPSPGFLVLTEPVPVCVSGTVYVTPQTGLPFFLRQLPDGRMLIGERAQDHVAHDPTTKHAQELVVQARRSFPDMAPVGVDHFTVDWRPMPRDGMPITGPLPGAPDVYVATAHSGVTIAPALGDLIAQELIGGKPMERLEPFRPERFSKHRTDAYASIEEAFEPEPTEVFLG